MFDFIYRKCITNDVDHRNSNKLTAESLLKYKIVKYILHPFNEQSVFLLMEVAAAAAKWRQNQHVPSQFRTHPDRPRLFPCPLQRRPTKSGKKNARAVLRINCQTVSTSASAIKIKINCVHSYPVGGGALAQSASTEGSEENCDEKLSLLENLARLLFAA